MNKKLLCAALLGSLGLAQAASAQEFDDRWYVSGSTGVNFQDSDRGTEDALFGTLGFGKFLTPRFSLETELNYQNPDKTVNPNLWWSQYGVSVDARYHFRNGTPSGGPTCAAAWAGSVTRKSTTTASTCRPRSASTKTPTSPSTSAPVCSSISAAWTCVLKSVPALISTTSRHVWVSRKTCSPTCWLRSA